MLAFHDEKGLSSTYGQRKKWKRARVLAEELVKQRSKNGTSLFLFLAQRCDVVPPLFAGISTDPIIQLCRNELCFICCTKYPIVKAMLLRMHGVGLKSR